MRIIQVNKFNYLRGGAEKYFIDISKELESLGHQVAKFSMKHPLNNPSPWDKYFVSEINFHTHNLYKKLFIPGRILYSYSAYRKFKKLIKDFHPDIIHFHNIYHQLSPSILKAAKEAKIPTILHLHDYKLICPNYKLFTNHKQCQRCQGGKYYHCLQYRCMENSRTRSFLAMIEMYLHHKILKIYKNNIDLFIAPSQFMKDISVQFSWPEKDIKVLKNFYTFSDTKLNNDPDDYLLYFGRLSEEKGIETILYALNKTKARLKIAGRGPDLDKLNNLSKKLKIESQVEFLGFKNQKELQELIKHSQVIIVPSLWPENMPFSLLESLANGKIVIASQVGGLPEIIKDNDNGLLFKAGNSNDLAKKINLVINHKINIDSHKIQESVKDLEFKNHIRKLLDIYQKTISKKRL